MSARQLTVYGVHSNGMKLYFAFFAGTLRTLRLKKREFNRKDAKKRKVRKECIFGGSLYGFRRAPE